ncbi:MAG: Fic family protein [Bacteroidales bacterium]|nr:Fic family protein [Bacteroidales bacterium]
MELSLNGAFKLWQSMQPLEEWQQELLRRKFTIEYNFNSNHIEGNTLTYGQTELLLLFGITSQEGHVKDFADMKASQVGMEMVQEAVQDHSMPLTQNFIRQLHKIILREDYTVYRNLPGGMQTSYTVHAGQYKTRPNSVITRYGDRFEYASPEETPLLMTDLVDWYNEAEREGKLSPVELAALFHYRYIRIHPFEDGNGRIARLMMNYILARHGWPMIVIRNRNKAAYLEALHKADMAVGTSPSKGTRATMGQAKHFIKYIQDTVRDEIMCDVSIVQNRDNDTWWYDGLMLKFRSESGSRILHMMKDNPSITYTEMADTLGINRSAVQGMVERMKAKGYLERRTSEGTWYVFAIQSREKDNR